VLGKNRQLSPRQTDVPLFRQTCCMQKIQTAGSFETLMNYLQVQLSDVTCCNTNSADLSLCPCDRARLVARIQTHRQALTLNSLTHAANLNRHFSKHCRGLSSAFISIDYVFPVTSTPKSQLTTHFCVSSSLSFHIPLPFPAIILRPQLFHSHLLLCPDLTAVYFILCSVIHTPFPFLLLFIQFSQHLISPHCLLCPI